MTRFYTIVAALFMATVLIAGANAGQASAHPYDAPQIGDIAEFYNPKEGEKARKCETYTKVSGRNVSGRTAFFVMERLNQHGEWWPISEGNDGAWASITDVMGDTVVYEGRPSVIVRSGESFEIRHYQSAGDTGEYRWVAMWTGGPTDRGLLAGWTAHRPARGCHSAA